MPFQTTISAKFPLRISNYQKDFRKQMAVESLWYNLSGRTEQGFQVANGGDASAIIPNEVIMVVKNGRGDGVETSIPSLDRLKKEGVHGNQVLSGTGEKVDMRWMKVAYNLHRKAQVIDDGTVDGDVAKAYDIAASKMDLFADWAVDLEDQAHTTSIIEGADDGLTDSTQWSNALGMSTYTNKTLHPNIYIKGLLSGATALSGLGAVTVDTSAAAGGSASDTLNAAISGSGWLSARAQLAYKKALISSSGVGQAAFVPGASYSFNKASLDNIANRAAFTVNKLGSKGKMSTSAGNSYGGKGYNFVLIISPIQANELANDTANAGWYTALINATPRESGTNKVLTGVIGVYRDMLIIVNPRQPVFSSADGSIAYWTVANDMENQLGHTAKSGANTGNCEIAILLGRQAIAEVTTADGNWSYTDEVRDHGLIMEYGMGKKYGVFRTEFFKQTKADGSNAFTIDGSTGQATATLAPTNWSSFLYLTPTSAVAM